MTVEQPRKPIAVEIKSPLKAKVERWILLESRLREVEHALLMLAKHFASATRKGAEIETSDEAAFLIQPLYCFAAVTYVRCFGGGRRAPLQIEDVPKLTARNRYMHEYIRSLRNRHFAHSVADEEMAYILAIPDQRGTKAGFIVSDVVLVGPSDTELREFIALVRKLLRYVHIQVRTAGDDLARAVFGQRASWSNCLRNGAALSKRDA